MPDDEPSTPPAEPNEPPAEPLKDPEPPKTFSQEDVNKLMAEEKRKAKAAAKAAEEAAAKLKALEDAKLSDEEKHKRDLEEREAKIAEKEAAIAREAAWNSKRSVADKAGLPGEVAAALRTYAESEDPEEIAGAIKAIFDYGNPTTPRGATPGGTGKPPAPMDWATKYREAEKRGDAATCLALLNEKK